MACKSEAEGDEAEADCEVACTGCGRCAADAPGVIEIRNNLARVDYGRNHAGGAAAIQRCPTGAIVLLDRKGVAERGAAAKKILRKSALPVVADEAIV